MSAVGATLVLWGHALAALLFGVVALGQLNRPGGWPQRAFVAALAVTALWALAVAGIDPGDVSARLFESLRDIAWLAFMLALVRRDRAGNWALAAVYAAVMTVAAVGASLAVLATLPFDGDAAHALAGVRLVFRMMVAVSALVLVQHLHATVAPPSRGGIRLIVVALAAMWGCDLLLFTAVYATGDWPAWLIVTRGFAMAGVAVLLGIAAHRRGDWTLAISRTAAMRSLSVVALVLYIGLVALATTLAAAFGGQHARIVQTAMVFGAAAALLTLVSTPWLRAWTKVKVAKHLFRHRYDYRAEWQRFTGTLGSPGEATLGARVVKAVADLTDSPAGLLLVPEGTGLGVGADWNWPGVGTDGNDALAGHLGLTGRIVELDAIRSSGGDLPVDVPPWLVEDRDAWAVVPLLHVGTLVGAIVLARPPVDRALDWEDFDLLRVAGRQAASYLAEDRAHAALADAQRFDEFNRRFAFIIHDLKNLVSQLSLVARNAERHAANPDFRADMVATLKDSADRMNALLARLSQHNGAHPEPLQPVDIAALVRRVARGRRAQHPIEAGGDAPLAWAQPARLEQVLNHLVQNAVEASAAVAPVMLAVAAIGGRVAIDVEDRGPGMSPAFLRDQLFRPFASTKPGGFGIGAFEARQLVEAMDGRIEVTSREGEGTRFRVLLPVAMAMEAAA